MKHLLIPPSMRRGFLLLLFIATCFTMLPTADSCINTGRCEHAHCCAGRFCKPFKIWRDTIRVCVPCDNGCPSHHYRPSGCSCIPCPNMGSNCTIPATQQPDSGDAAPTEGYISTCSFSSGSPVCTKCPPCTIPGYFGQGQCINGNATCVPCSTCSHRNQFVRHACNGTHDTVCGLCPTCPPGRYMTACGGPSARHPLGNATCKRCSVCPDGHYRAWPCTSMADTQCRRCTECPHGTRRQPGTCSGSVNSVCLSNTPSITATATPSTAATPSTTRSTSLSPSVGTASVSHEPTATVPLEPEAPTPIRNPRRVQLVISSVVGETAGTAIVGTGASATVVSSALGPGAVTQMSRIVAAVEVIECSFSGDGAAPSYFEHPVHPAIGSGPARYYAGGVLVSAATTGVAMAALLGLFRWALSLEKRAAATAAAGSGDGDATASSSSSTSKSSSSSSGSSSSTTSSSSKNIIATSSSFSRRVLKVVSVFANVAVSFFTPNVVGGAATVFWHSEAKDAMALFLTAVSCVVAVGVVGCAADFALRAPSWALVPSSSPRTKAKPAPVTPADDDESSSDDDDDDGSSTTTSSSSSVSVESKPSPKRIPSPLQLHSVAFGLFFDAAKEAAFHRPLVRLYLIEDIVSASVMAFVGGSRPGGDTCGMLGGLLISVALLHLAYLVVLRPFESRLEMGCMLLFAVNQLALCVFCQMAMQDAAYMEYVGFCVLVQSASFIGQALVMCMWTVAISHKRRMKQMQELLEADASPPPPGSPPSERSGSTSVCIQQQQPSNNNINTNDSSGGSTLTVPLLAEPEEDSRQNPMSNPL